MYINANKLVLLVDLEDKGTYNKITYLSNSIQKIYILHGSPDTIIKDQIWDDCLFETIDEPTIPKDMMSSVYLDHLSPHTIVFMLVRKNHMLMKTSLLPVPKFIDVLYSPINDSLLYIFSKFEENGTFRIAPNLMKDSIGAIESLKEELTNHPLRNKILALINYEKIPKNYLKKASRESIGELNNIGTREPNIIIDENNADFKITFNGIEYELKKSLPLCDAINILRENFNSDKINKINELLERSRNKINGKSKANKKYNLDSLTRSFNRLLLKIREYEELKKIDTKTSFAKFLHDTIKFQLDKESISCTIPPYYKIKFL